MTDRPGRAYRREGCSPEAAAHGPDPDQQPHNEPRVGPDQRDDAGRLHQLGRQVGVIERRSDERQAAGDGDRREQRVPDHGERRVPG
jgi:hypothetical protein